MENSNVLSAVTEIIDTKWIFAGVKIFFLIGLAIFCFFSLSIFRQSQLMDNVLKIPIKPSFKSISLVFFLATLTYLVLAFIFL